MVISLRRLHIALAIVAALAAGALSASQSRAQKIGSQGGSFELTDQNGRPFSSLALAGRPYAIFFGYTHCPDICPTTLLEMSNHLAALGADAGKLAVVFVTVDPERDTPELLHSYLASFDARIIGLTGSEAGIAEAAKGWDAFYNRIPESDGSVTVVHSAHVYLMDAENRVAGTLNFQEAEDVQLAKLQALLAGKPIN
jgi:protein SCO1/2